MSEATASARPHPEPLEHFDSFERQRSAALLGMWVFLANELLLFAGIFLAVVALRLLYPEAVLAAGEHLKWWLGAINTVILISSSLAMSVAIEASKLLRRDLVRRALLVTAGLGLLFLTLKAGEYYLEYEEHLIPFISDPFALEADATKLYLNLYFAATGLHSLHLLIGIGIVLGLWWRARRDEFLRKRPLHIEISGLYWHFIDFVWVFLFSIVYLANRA